MLKRQSVLISSNRMATVSMVTIADCSYSMILMLLVILYIDLLYVDLENKDSLRVYCDVTTQ